MPLNVKWYYDRVRDIVVVATTTTTYTPLHVGYLNNVAEVPPISAPADLPKFLWAPLAWPEYELRPEVKPISEPKPLLEYISLLELNLCLLIYHLWSPLFQRYQSQDKFVDSQQWSLSRHQTHMNQILQRQHLQQLVEFPNVVLDMNELLVHVGFTPRSFLVGLVVGGVTIEFLARHVLVGGLFSLDVQQLQKLFMNTYDSFIVQFLVLFL